MNKERMIIDIIKEKVSSSAEEGFVFKDNKTELAVAAALMGHWNIIDDSLGGLLLVALYELCGGEGSMMDKEVDELLDGFFNVEDGLNEDGTPIKDSEWYRDFMVRSGLCFETEV